MSGSSERLSRGQLLAALGTGWGQFLPTLAQWPAAEQTRYARHEGYPRVQDVLAHVCAWWEETLRVVPMLLTGQSPGYDYSDVDAFNAHAVARYQARTRAQVEAKFEKLRLGIENLIAALPAAALDDDEVYAWVFNAAVEHYEEHQPPNGPRVR